MDKQNPTSKNSEPVVSKVLGVIGTVILMLGGYALWVNSRAFDFDILGMTFRMPFEGNEHYCRRKSSYVFMSDDAKYDECIKNTGSGSTRHDKLVDYVLKTFDDGTGHTVLTNTQANCIAKKIEARLTDAQVDRAINGTPIGDMVDASVTMQVMGDIGKCIE